MNLFGICRISIIRLVKVIKKFDLVNKNDSNGHNTSSYQPFIIKFVGKNGRTKLVCISSLKKGDIVEISAGEIIPYDGEIIEGFATVDESAITGESAFVVREAGGELSKVTGGTRVICNTIRIKIISPIKFVDKKENKINSKVNHMNFEV